MIAFNVAENSFENTGPIMGWDELGLAISSQLPPRCSKKTHAKLFRKKVGSYQMSGVMEENPLNVQLPGRWKFEGICLLGVENLPRKALNTVNLC